MKKLHKLSVALGAIVGAAAPLMMSGSLVNAAEKLTDKTQNTVQVVADPDTDVLQIVEVPDMDFGTVSATEIYTSLDQASQTTTGDLRVNDGRIATTSEGWKLQGKLGKFISTESNELSETELTFTATPTGNNSEGGINFNGTPLITDAESAVTLVTHGERGTKSILESEISATLKNDGSPEITVEDAEVFTAVLDWNLASGVAFRSL
ncbi:WxL domain-containing protein [Lacticaseibacillus sp. N501-2]|uniref:WxL domain-containing protein n=1 Tax=Lacticaseibacillus salsurae TaxID=3367729 RepID=UPI0038B29CBC